MRPHLLHRGPASAVYDADTVDDADAVARQLAEGWGCRPEQVTARRQGHLAVFVRHSPLSIVTARPVPAGSVRRSVSAETSPSDR